MTKRLGMASATLAVLLSGAGAAYSQPWGGHGNMMGWGHGWGWLGILVMVIVWALVILGIVALIRWLWMAGPRRGAAPGSSPLDIVKQRYARGEINKEEFEQKKKDLGS